MTETCDYHYTFENSFCVTKVPRQYIEKEWSFLRSCGGISRLIPYKMQVIVCVSLDVSRRQGFVEFTIVKFFLRRSRVLGRLGALLMLNSGSLWFSGYRSKALF